MGYTNVKFENYLFIMARFSPIIWKTVSNPPLPFKLLTSNSQGLVRYKYDKLENSCLMTGVIIQKKNV